MLPNLFIKYKNRNCKKNKVAEHIKKGFEIYTRFKNGGEHFIF